MKTQTQPTKADTTKAINLKTRFGALAFYQLMKISKNCSGVNSFQSMCNWTEWMLTSDPMIN